jgi:hypothetical protein
MQPIRAEEFLATVAPALDAGDVDRLCETVREHWSVPQLCGLLKHHDVVARRAAVVVLGMVGDRAILGCLTRCLHDPDQQVHQFAEDALWSIWFRSGKPEAARHFQAGVRALAEDQFDDAIEAFASATDIDPQFAEAYNQRAIAHYLNHQWKDSLDAGRRALALIPTHFGALAGLGHAHAHRGELRQAIDCYRRALAINPHLHATAQAQANLQKQLADADQAPPSALPTTDPLVFPPNRLDAI